MKPTLGHPSRIAAIIALRKENKTETEIARLIGIKPNTVTSIECRARRRGYTGRKGPQPGVLRLGGAVLADLHEEAERRGTTAGELARKLLYIVSRDDLFAAVLDDRP